MLRIIPYSKFSKSVKSIVTKIGKQTIRKKLPYNQPLITDVIINWGCSNIQFNTNHNKILNKPECVKVASNKLDTFVLLSREKILVPKFSTDKVQAQKWIDKGFRVLCRHLLTSHSGKGIEILNKETATIPDAPLYVKYIKKVHEFRVHIFNGVVIDYVEKKKRIGTTNTNNLIRSHDNDWVFCRTDILVRDDIKELAIKSVKALGLDFGAVDCIIDSKDRPMILEVNTAPGLEGTTLAKYTQAIKEIV